MTTQTPIIDSQVHAYERDRPERPWAGTLTGPDEVTGDDMVAAMDAVGVDGALLVSPYSNSNRPQRTEWHATAKIGLNVSVSQTRLSA